MLDAAHLTAEELIAVIADLTKTVKELKASIRELEDENCIMREENKCLRRKLYGPKSETSHLLGFEQLSFFDDLFNESEKEYEQEVLEEISYTKKKKKFRDQCKFKLENLKHVKVVYDIDEKDRICSRCGAEMHSVGEKSHIHVFLNISTLNLVHSQKQ